MSGSRVIASSVAKLGCSDDQPSRASTGQIKIAPLKSRDGRQAETTGAMLRGELRTQPLQAEINGPRQGPRLRTIGTRTPEVLGRSRQASGGVTYSGSRCQGNVRPPRLAHCCVLASNGQSHLHDRIDSLRPPSRMHCLGRHSRKHGQEDEAFSSAMESRRWHSRYTQLRESPRTVAIATSPSVPTVFKPSRERGSMTRMSARQWAQWAIQSLESG